MLPNKEFSSRPSEAFHLQRIKDWSVFLEQDFDTHSERDNAQLRVQYKGTYARTVLGARIKLLGDGKEGKGLER